MGVQDGIREPGQGAITVIQLREGSGLDRGGRWEMGLFWACFEGKVSRIS